MRKLRPLSGALATKAAVELNENPADIDYYLRSLREWAEQQTHLKSRTSEQFLIVFLRSSKYSLEKAKQKLDNFYTYRALMPEIFKGRDLENPKVRTIIKSGCVLHLPEPVAADGPRIIMIRPSRFDMEKHSIPDVFQVGSMATDILLYEDDNAIVAGYEVVMDLANMPAAVILSFDPTFAKKLTILANKISPTRLKGFHFLNVPPIFEKLFSMVKSVINVKLRKRFHVHGSNYEKLYERIPRHVLPKEYGGECDIEKLQVYWWDKLNEHEDFLREEDCFGAIKDSGKSCSARLRAEAAVAPDNIFGANGSFRKLNLD